MFSDFLEWFVAAVLTIAVSLAPQVAGPGGPPEDPPRRLSDEVIFVSERDGEQAVY